MKLQKFKEKDKKKKVIIGATVVTVLLLAGILLYRTFAIYEEKSTFDVIKGQVPDQKYDLMFSFFVEDESGNQTYSDTAPEGTDWGVNVSCNNGATGIWDYTSWGPRVTNLSQVRTKCKVTFKPVKSLVDTIKAITPVTTGNGLYQVTHSDANITYTTNTTAINNLKMTELRYAGKNPNNYVTFNNELWRIIGLVNTPEGQRVKIIRNESIGNYSWDSSSSSVNAGYGVNEWSQADVMKLLNPGYESESVGGSLYWNRGTGTCYCNTENGTTSCDFSSKGLGDEAKAMIDTITWNTGTHNYSSYDPKINPVQYYNYERSSNAGRTCVGGSCNDTVSRLTTWKGKVGLMYPSDYGYATSGGSAANRTACLENPMSDWGNSNVSYCKNNDWLFASNQWTIFRQNDYYNALQIYSGDVFQNIVYYPIGSLRPTVYLVNNIKVVGGDGTSTKPYQIIKN